MEAWSCTYRETARPGHEAEHLAELGVRVLSTPCLALYMERAARRCLDERAGVVSVGYRVEVKHRRPVAIGEELLLEARIYYWDGRRGLVYVRALRAGGEVVAEMHNERYARERR